MKHVIKIIGFPTKLFGNNMVYVPYEYLRFYGISVTRDRLAIIKQRQSISFRPILSGEVRPKGTVASIRNGLLVLPVAWIRNNGLKKGDHLFILGVTNGFIVYTP